MRYTESDFKPGASVKYPTEPFYPIFDGALFAPSPKDDILNFKDPLKP